MVVDPLMPKWACRYLAEYDLERIYGEKILVDRKQNVRVKYTDDLLSTILLQREALWLERVSTLGIETHRCLGLEKDGERGILLTSYIEGESLDEVMRCHERVRSLADKRQQISWSILDKLEELHRVDIVHGDLKPSNILLKKDGTLCFIDFSNARRVGDAWVERRVVQQTHGFTYPRHSKHASVLYDYYSVLVSLAILYGDSPSTQPDNALGFLQQFKANVDALNFSSELAGRLIQLTQQVLDDLS